MVFIFDEAHLLFDGAPAHLLQAVERLVRLVRSKGVAVFLVTQSVSDVPPTILAQLGTRIQHALRCYTPADQKMIRAAAQSFRPNPGIDIRSAITSLATGEALDIRHRGRWRAVDCRAGFDPTACRPHRANWHGRAGCDQRRLSAAAQVRGDRR